MKFNKLMAKSVLLIALVAWCIGMLLFIPFTDQFNNLLLATVVYFNAALFASIFSGLLYPE